MSDSQEQPATFPPMAISDLLVLTLTVSVAMACIAPSIQDFLAIPANELRIPRWRGVAPELTDYTSIGLALFGLLVLARQRLRGSTVALAPGHWIFIAIGPYMMLLLAFWVLQELLPELINHPERRG